MMTLPVIGFDLREASSRDDLRRAVEDMLAADGEAVPTWVREQGVPGYKVPKHLGGCIRLHALRTKMTTVDEAERRGEFDPDKFAALVDEFAAWGDWHHRVEVIR